MMSVVPGRFAKKEAGRRLKRNVTTDALPIEIGKVYCIRGAIRKAWMVLPVQQVQGRDCVSITNSSSWLMHLLGGVRRARDHRGAVANFVLECAELFMKASSQVGPATAENLAPLADEASSQDASAKRPRSRILGSDDEADPGVLVPEAPKRGRGRGRRPRRTRRGEWVNLEVRGIPLSFTLLSGPKIVVDMEASLIQRIVDDLLPRRGEARQGLTDEADKTVKQHITRQDKGRLQWRPPSWRAPGCWTVVFLNALGERSSSCAGLRVPRVSLSGEVLNVEELTAAALQLQTKARREWNRLDHSDAERYIL